MPGPEQHGRHARPAAAREPVAGDQRRLAAGQPLRWRVNGKLLVLKCVGAAVFVVVAALSLGDPVRTGVAALAAVWLAVLALRDLLAPVRVAADRDGITLVVGYAGHRRLPWSQIQRVRVDRRARLGVRSELLEIDAGDSIHFYSSYELGAPCDDVAQRLAALRTGGAA
jgi:hypothetical protein